MNQLTPTISQKEKYMREKKKTDTIEHASTHIRGVMNELCDPGSDLLCEYKYVCNPVCCPIREIEGTKKYVHAAFFPIFPVDTNSARVRMI